MFEIYLQGIATIHQAICNLHVLQLCKTCAVNFMQKLSWVDIQGYTLFDGVAANLGVNLADYPEIQKLVDFVGSQSNIKKWIETRPKSDF